MSVLFAGLVLWSVLHFFPACAPVMRNRLIDGYGEYPYKGVFTLLMLVAVGMIIVGWSMSSVENIYMPPTWGVYVTNICALFMFITFFAPYMNNNLTRFLQHPQLIGFAAWGIGHLFSNGESRSLLLFGGLAAWALIDMILIIKRDGASPRVGTASPIEDLRLLLVGLGFFAIMLFTHVLLFGVSPIPR